MSKFIEAISSNLTGHRKAAYVPLKTRITEINYATAQMDYLNEYDISVVWSRRIHCRSKDIPDMLDNAVRELREVIYGDIKHRLLELERHVYEGDMEASKSAIRDIIGEVYGTQS